MLCRLETLVEGATNAGDMGIHYTMLVWQFSEEDGLVVLQV
jgi:hypothetical protein